MRQPWGNSAQSACRWAFAQLATAGDMPSLLGDLRGPTKERRELERLELRGQAAIIRRHVETIDDQVPRSYLVALYLPQPEELRQPGHTDPATNKYVPGDPEFVERFGAQRKVAIHVIGWWLLKQQGSGVHRIRGYNEIAAQYFVGGNRNLDRIRELLKMKTERVGEQRKRCEDMLKDLDRRAHAIVDARLYEAGIIT